MKQMVSKLCFPVNFLTDLQTPKVLSLFIKVELNLCSLQDFLNVITSLKNHDNLLITYQEHTFDLYNYLT